MVVRHLSLHDFRNLESVELDPAPGLNLLCGANAQGKTSTLEGVWVVSCGRVLRGSRDVGAVRQGQEACRVAAVLDPTGSELAVEFAHGRNKRALLNGMKLPRASDLMGRLPVVCFWSGDLALATGEPAERRLFVDHELCQLSPAYLRDLALYKRALEQRNALLRRAQESYVRSEAFEAWEAPMAESGRRLRLAREEWVGELHAAAAQAHADLADGEALTVRYHQNEDAPDLIALYAEHRPREIARGSSQVGPHRDDLRLEIAGNPLREFGSQGQQRTAVISLKLATLKVAQARLGFHPVLLLDDIFSDLDQSRRSALVRAALREGGQVFLTCTEPEQAGEDLLGRARVFAVNSGTVQPDPRYQIHGT